MNSNENSRIGHINREILEGIVSRDQEAVKAVIEELPIALTPQEISDIGRQVCTLAFTEESRSAKALKRDGIFNLGLIALIEREDMVTAENAAIVLRKQGIKGLADSRALKLIIRDAEKEIVELIIS